MLGTALKILSPSDTNYFVFSLNHGAQEQNSACFGALPACNATKKFLHASYSLLYILHIAIEKRREPWINK